MWLLFSKVKFLYDAKKGCDGGMLSADCSLPCLFYGSACRLPGMLLDIGFDCIVRRIANYVWHIHAIEFVEA